MNIVHLCLSCFYIDGFAYQENQLVAQHVADGHSVTVVASTESFDETRKVTYLKPTEYLGTDGARVIRLEYRKLFPHKLATKIRTYPRVLEILESLKPDILFFHGLCAWELMTAAAYVKKHRDTLLYVDCHEDFNNSARSPLSKWGLHFSFYRPIIRHCLPYIRKVLCVSQESMTFAHQLYGIASAKLEFFPLGGNVLDNEAYTTLRTEARRHYGWNDDKRVFVQSGKIDHAKRLRQTIVAFSALKDSTSQFVIAGKILPEVECEVRQLINADNRILETGWLEPNDLQSLLCAADVYVQPGSQSATMQMSLCCRCPVILDDVPSHRALFENNGFLVFDQKSLTEAIHSLASMPKKQLVQMALKSAEIAKKYLDYQQQALRVLQ